MSEKQSLKTLGQKNNITNKKLILFDKTFHGAQLRNIIFK